MKGNSKETYINAILILVLFTSGCSTFSNMTKRKNLLSSYKKDKKVKMVSQAQYDQLLSKYDRLLKQTQNSNPKLAGNTKKQVTTSKVDPSEIVSDIANLGDNVELAETVSVFDRKNMAKKSKASIPSAIPSIGKSKNRSFVNPSESNKQFVNEEIALLKKATEFLRLRKYNEAMDILKNLENSKVKQVMVRAKYLIGDMLFEREKYDLALQVFEEIINNYAFSSVILKSLGKLIVCSERLNLVKRKNQYYSILHDFFEG